ncbi:MAG: transposase [Anaerolineales bacterium]|nr:MAG: transposase [Anaerolineales bacterium]
MSKNLLLVTADASFARALLQGLVREGFGVHVANRKSEAVVRADEKDCTLAFLDLNLGEPAVAEIGSALRALKPNMRLAIFADADAPPALDELHPWMLLRKPYYLPELIAMLNQDSTPLSKPISRPAQTDEAALPWLQDVTKAAQHLTRLTLESAAQAALITRNNKMWAYAGGLEQNAANELALTVTRHWDGQKGSDLLRFVRLETTKAEHMLYATRLADDVVLALVFDAETPFSAIRSQAGKLADSLLLSDAEAEQTPPMPNQLNPEYDRSVSAAYEAPTQLVDEGGEDDIPSIADILADVPPPTPDAVVYPLPPEAIGTRPSSPARATQYSRESSPAVRVDELLVSHQNLEETVEHVVQDFDATMPSQSRPRPETPVRRPMPGELDETRPHSITEVASRVMLEPISPGLYNLTYACLLVPRFSSHYLTGDVSDRLSEWLPQICIAFGWRLEYLAVRPEYMQWVTNVPPSASPGYLMRIMRQQTSEKIFAEFSRLKKENPSGDFWAPGYLIMGGTQPHPPQLVQNYIKETRTRQGYADSRK